MNRKDAVEKLRVARNSGPMRVECGKLYVTVPVEALDLAIAALAAEDARGEPVAWISQTSAMRLRFAHEAGEQADVTAWALPRGLEDIGLHVDLSAAQGEPVAAGLVSEISARFVFPVIRDGQYLRNESVTISESEWRSLLAMTGEADEILTALGLDPARFRSEGGFVNAAKVAAAVKRPSDYSGYYATPPADKVLVTVAPIERDERMDRTYIPLPGGWEVQTKGKGSTFRICEPNGERLPIPNTPYLHETLERMARDIHAACTTLPPSAVPEDAIEAAYWDFDARQKGYGKHAALRQSERDAFKWAVRAMLAAAPEPKENGRG